MEKWCAFSSKIFLCCFSCSTQNVPLVYWTWFPFHCHDSSQCPNGHTLCSKCQTKVRCCPICRHELGNIRCLALERVAESLELPCKYQIHGCQDIFPYHGRLRHEQNCRFRPYKCPYAGADCPVSGSVPFLVEHLKRDHNVDMHDGSTFNHRYVKSNPQDVENATWMLTVSAFLFSYIPSLAWSIN